MKTLSFLIVDDHELVLSGLQKLVYQYYPKAFICTAKSAEDAIIQLGQKQWDFVITDVSLPGKSGIELVQIIKEKSSESKIIVVTQHTELWIIKQLVEVAPDAIALKMNEQEEIIKAIQLVWEGKTYFSATVHNLIVNILQANRANEISSELTEREIAIIRLIASGLTSKEIAAELFISEKTVEVHRKNLFVKFDVKNSASLIHKASKAGLI